MAQCSTLNGCQTHCKHFSVGTDNATTMREARPRSRNWIACGRLLIETLEFLDSVADIYL
jgi:hypothetical protein